MTLSVVLPARDAQSLVGDAVRGFVAELATIDGELIVVDDGSVDGTAQVAEAAGARVLVGSGAGPYAARNLAWPAARYDRVAFVDVRCRPRPGWVRAVIDALEHGAGAVGGDVVVRDGPTLAARAAAQLQPLRLPDADRPFFLPFAPTCHLVVERRHLADAGGFAGVRGGGDVDLCWRLQHDLGVDLRPAADAVLEWVPRVEVAALVGQMRRYGHNLGRLVGAWRTAGCPRPPVPAPARVALHEARAALAASAGPGVALVVGRARAAYAAGLREGLATRDAALGPKVRPVT